MSVKSRQKRLVWRDTEPDISSLVDTDMKHPVGAAFSWVLSRLHRESHSAPNRKAMRRFHSESAPIEQVFRELFATHNVANEIIESSVTELAVPSLSSHACMLIDTAKSPGFAVALCSLYSALSGGRISTLIDSTSKGVNLTGVSPLEAASISDFAVMRWDLSKGRSLIRQTFTPSPHGVYPFAGRCDDRFILDHVLQRLWESADLTLVYTENTDLATDKVSSVIVVCNPDDDQSVQKTAEIIENYPGDHELIIVALGHQEQFNSALTFPLDLGITAPSVPFSLGQLSSASKETLVTLLHKMQASEPTAD